MKTQKQIVCIFLLFIFCLSSFIWDKASAQSVLKGSISAVVEKGHTFEISLTTPVNFYFSQTGDDISAFTNKDIFIGDDLYIPKGSRLNGIIKEIKEPKHFGQNGSFEIELNEIITQENISIPIYASVSTDTSKPQEKIASTLSYDTALIAFGIFNGAIASVQYGGIPLLIASHGISVLAGAGLGAGAGVIGSVLRKGRIPSVLNETGTKVALKSNLYVFGELPKISDLRPQTSDLRKEEQYLGFRFFPQVKKEDIEIQIINVKNEHSKIYGDYIVLSFKLKNNSEKPISLSDFVLVEKSSEGTFATDKPLHPDLFLSGTEALKSIKPFDESSASLAFIITKKLDDYCLSLIDPLDRKVVLRVPLYEK